MICRQKLILIPSSSCDMLSCLTVWKSSLLFTEAKIEIILIVVIALTPNSAMAKGIPDDHF